MSSRSRGPRVSSPIANDFACAATNLPWKRSGFGGGGTGSPVNLRNRSAVWRTREEIELCTRPALRS
ncbi:hypothetical protein [Nocardia xishanensis]